MSHKQRGITVADGYWCKHLRPWLKRMFWKRQRKAFKKELRNAR